MRPHDLGGAEYGTVQPSLNRSLSIHVHGLAYDVQTSDVSSVGFNQDSTIIDSISLNPQFLGYDPVADSGINVGYNSREQTVAPGESKKYLWYADKEYDSCLLQSFGDMRNHRYHGLFGAILIEPADAAWYPEYPAAG